MNKFKMKIIVLLSLSLFTLNSLATISCTSSISDYPYNTNQEPIAEKVQSNGRVYFFSLPKNECKTSTFLINNDKVLKYREENGFSFINYINKKGAVVDGWVRSEYIVSDNVEQNGLTYSDFSWKINGQNVYLLGKATPELNTWVKQSGLKLPEPENHGFNYGFESWTLTILNEMITISQANEIIEKRLGFNDAYVSGITFVDDKYTTARGVKVGDDWSTVTAKYGTKSKLNSENECRFYPYFDMKLSFCLDQSNKVQTIIFESYPEKP
ncbi:hypothetical protein LHV18_00985 [Providencia rettgeri]|uniref:hypothetical protein n=1 Tax=Providencia TaxID=586 RepID=UPI001CFDA94E|nr:hypothetical protein [Providencia rettgeri]EIU7556887.1 hypothetical protein [Providencia rettgeri]EMA4781685.1 hypothetical protein [Providencia rettgeri]MCB4839211.1 hypothetical protein [Providencia rettgeri]HEM8305088.1 hypothetical protein [Providencia rettgeri]